MEKEKSNAASPKKLVNQKKKEETKEKEEPLKRMRLEILTQIKYTLIYDEQVDRPGIDKLLSEYEEKVHKQNILEIENSKPEQIIDAISGEVIDVASGSPKRPDGDDLFREVREEDKLDEQAAKKEEIEAAEDEEKGIAPKIRPLMSIRESDDDEGDEEEGTDEDYH